MEILCSLLTRIVLWTCFWTPGYTNFLEENDKLPQIKLSQRQRASWLSPHYHGSQRFKRSPGISFLNETVSIDGGDDKTSFTRFRLAQSREPNVATAPLTPNPSSIPRSSLPLISYPPPPAYPSLPNTLPMPYGLGVPDVYSRQPMYQSVTIYPALPLYQPSSTGLSYPNQPTGQYAPCSAKSRVQNPTAPGVLVAASIVQPADGRSYAEAQRYAPENSDNSYRPASYISAPDFLARYQPNMDYLNRAENSEDSYRNGVFGKLAASERSTPGESPVRRDQRKFRPDWKPSDAARSTGRYEKAPEFVYVKRSEVKHIGGLGVPLPTYFGPTDRSDLASTAGEQKSGHSGNSARNGIRHESTFQIDEQSMTTYPVLLPVKEKLRSFDSVSTFIIDEIENNHPDPSERYQNGQGETVSYPSGIEHGANPVIVLSNGDVLESDDNDSRNMTPWYRPLNGSRPGWEDPFFARNSSSHADDSGAVRNSSWSHGNQGAHGWLASNGSRILHTVRNDFYHPDLPSYDASPEAQGSCCEDRQKGNALSSVPSTQPTTPGTARDSSKTTISLTKATTAIPAGKTFLDKLIQSLLG